MNPPKVEMKWSWWCNEHLSQLVSREDWPEGAATAMMAMFHVAVRNKRLVAAMPKDSEGKANPAAITPVFDEHAPLCCFIGEEDFGEIKRLFHNPHELHREGSPPE